MRRFSTCALWLRKLTRKTNAHFGTGSYLLRPSQTFSRITVIFDGHSLLFWPKIEKYSSCTIQKSLQWPTINEKPTIGLSNFEKILVHVGHQRVNCSKCDSWTKTTFPGFMCQSDETIINEVLLCLGKIERWKHHYWRLLYHVLLEFLFRRNSNECELREFPIPISCRFARSIGWCRRHTFHLPQTAQTALSLHFNYFAPFRHETSFFYICYIYRIEYNDSKNIPKLRRFPTHQYSRCEKQSTPFLRRHWPSSQR